MQAWENKEDIDLVKAIIGSDQKAFETLYRRYANALYQFTWRKLGNESTSEELVQECFTKVWRNRHRLDPKQSIRAYLFQAIRNLLIDTYRKSKEMVSIEQEEVLPPHSSHEKGIFQRDEIQTAFQALTPMQYQIFSMSRFDGLTYKEIGQALDLSVKTVEGHMGRALKSLRTNLQHLVSIFLIILGMQ